MKTKFSVEATVIYSGYFTDVSDRQLFHSGS